MNDPVIRVEHLSKKYILDHQKQERYTALRDVIAQKARSLVNQLNFSTQNSTHNAQIASKEEFWALQDVSFEIQRGDRVGIIGRNGAGKSTLLKILSRITEPTDGTIWINGRVASLLEVGTGFHPELTGRENIFLNGAILGMSKAEIQRKFDEIVAFSEVEKFLDTPVKRYSSGMYVRLAFAVAAHLEPEILIVDEVLAVGDVQFQKKCLGKMEAVSKEGRTVLFVSHNMGAIYSLTQTCIYLKQGKVLVVDQTHKTVEKYVGDSIENKTNELISIDYFRRDPSTDSPVSIEKIWVNDVLREFAQVGIGQDFNICVEVLVKREIQKANLTAIIKNIEGYKITVLFSWDYDVFLSLPEGRHLIEIKVKDVSLAPGKYFADVGINQSTTTKAFDVITDFPLFEVVNTGQIVQWLERPWGTVHLNKVEWDISNHISD
jgi:lipopolysaccharide transport system ATP-binding protein